jgi:hypothetical protein
MIMCCQHRGPREAKHVLCVASGGGSTVNFNFAAFSLLKTIIHKELIQKKETAIID